MANSVATNKRYWIVFFHDDVSWKRKSAFNREPFGLRDVELSLMVIDSREPFPDRVRW